MQIFLLLWFFGAVLICVLAIVTLVGLIRALFEEIKRKRDEK